MIEWMLGAAIPGALGSLFGASGASRTSPRVPRQPLAIKLEEGRSAKETADRLLALRAPVEDLASSRCYRFDRTAPAVARGGISGQRPAPARPQGLASHALGRRGGSRRSSPIPRPFATFVKAELVGWSDLFDRIGSGPFTLDQRLAKVTDEGATLVLASAGSGKTSAIAAKVAYLVESGLRPASEILMLAFNKDAVGEMKARRDAQGVTGVGARTLQRLANFIIGAVEGRKPPVADHATDAKAFRALIGKILSDLFVARSMNHAGFTGGSG